MLFSRTFYALPMGSRVLVVALGLAPGVPSPPSPVSGPSSDAALLEVPSCQPHRCLFHKAPEILRLHAWRLSSVSSEREVFRAEQLDSYLNQFDSPRQQSTRLSGGSTVVGVSRGVWILARPLL